MIRKAIIALKAGMVLANKYSNHFIVINSYDGLSGLMWNVVHVEGYRIEKAEPAKYPNPRYQRSFQPIVSGYDYAVVEAKATGIYATIFEELTKNK